MPNYQNTLIYTLGAEDTDKVVVGHTAVPLWRRMAQHRYDAKINKKLTSCEIFKYSNPFIKLYEAYPCNNVQEAREREGEVIRLFQQKGICLNHRVENRTRNEWENTNKDILKEKSKQWREANKNVIREKKKAYHEANRNVILEKQKAYREANRNVILEKNKAHYDANKVELCEKAKAYREANKERVKENKRREYLKHRDAYIARAKKNRPNNEKTRERQSEKIMCECGVVIRHSSMSVHRNTWKHIHDFIHL
jgi:hypothetical protein